jgi:flagellar protein FlaG
MAISISNVASQAVSAAPQAAAGAESTGQVVGSGASSPVAAEVAEKPKVETTEAPSVKEVRQAAEDVARYVDSVSRSLQISVDGELDKPIVTVLDSTTEQVVRQIPSEEIVAIAKFLRSQGAEMAGKETISGILLNKQG